MPHVSSNYVVPVGHRILLPHKIRVAWSHYGRFRCYMSLFFGALIAMGTVVETFKKRMTFFWILICVTAAFAVLGVGFLNLLGLVAGEWIGRVWVLVSGITTALSGLSMEGRDRRLSIGFGIFAILIAVASALMAYFS